MISPKPHPLPKPQRLPERKAVTIVAGFKCYEGIVLCADTQETVSNLSKRNVPKLRFEPSEGVHEGDGLAVAFCGAGDNAAFIDKVVETAWEDAQAATNVDEACASIEKSVKDSYKEFGRIFQPGYCPTADLIYGVKMYSTCRLFSAHGPVVTEKNGYDTAGAGYYMADFLASRMHNHLMSIQQCAVLAAYILFQAKEHVDGCGGESQIAVLRDDGVSGVADRRYIKTISELLEFSDSQIGDLLLQTANFDLNTEKFKKMASSTIDMLEVIRSSNRDELEESQKRLVSIASLMSGRPSKPIKKDWLGLPMPSGSQTSED